MSNNNKERLMILLDSTTLKSDNAKRLLKYNDNQVFEFVSWGASTAHTEIKLFLDDTKKHNKTVIDKSSKDGYYTDSLFISSRSRMERISKSLNINYEDLLPVFILEHLTRFRHNERKIILVTERKKILDRLNWKKGGFPNVPDHTILHPDEAAIFIDLYCKQQKKFLIAPNHYVSSGGWYLYSLKTKLTRYQGVWSIAVYGKKVIPEGKNIMEFAAALADRITDMLIAIDEIGINYYTNVNNDTQDIIIYHFNYWITLFTGVLDTLALISKYRYQIKFDNPMEVDLRKSEFKKKLFSENQIFGDFFNKNSLIINLMHNPRNLVTHRERLKGLRLENSDENFCFNVVRIPAEFFIQIVRISKERGNAIEEWGCYKHYDDCFLEPYRFVQNATAVLIEFADEYLELLNFDKYKVSNPALKKNIVDRDDFAQKLEDFKNFNLGY